MYYKSVLRFISLFLFGIILVSCAINPERQPDNILTIPVDRDAYGKFVIDGDVLEGVSDYAVKFKQFIHHVRTHHYLMPIIISLSVKKNHSALFSIMKFFQFEMYHVDNPEIKVEWIFRNGRKVPEADTTSLGTNVIFTRVNNGEKEVLLVKDVAVPTLIPPGGYVDRGETAEIGAARECKEEVNVTVDPCKLKLVGIFHKINRGEKQPVSLSVFIFTHPITDNDVANIKLEEQEIAWYRFVKLSEIDRVTGTILTAKGYLTKDGSESRDKEPIKIHPNFLPILNRLSKEDEIKTSVVKLTPESMTYVF